MKLTCMVSSMMSTSKTPGIKPAPIPWILCGPAYKNLGLMSPEQAVSRNKAEYFWCKLVLKVPLPNWDILLFIMRSHL
jgi:hypothetical protein